jgi:F-type H+-transporting ATPase subunit epsilon
VADLPKEIFLEVATPLGKQLEVSTDSVQVPSVAGEFGVLPGHLPLLAAIKPGILQYRADGKMVRVAIGAGYAEGNADRVRVISEFFVRAEDVDLERAQEDLQEATERLKHPEGTTEDTSYVEAQRNHDWAQARIDLAGTAQN